MRPPPRRRRASTPAKSSKGAHIVGPGQERSRARRDRRQARVRPPPSRAAAARGCRSPLPGELEELVLVEPDQRALQQRGEREVVLRQQQEAAERQQVRDRELLGQHHAVDAGDRQAALLQRAHQRVDEAVAPAHQHQDVARLDGAVAAVEPGLAAGAPARLVGEPDARSRGHELGQPHLRRDLARLVAGSSQGSGPGALSPSTSGQSSTRPPCPSRVGLCAGTALASAAARPSRRLRRAKTASTACSTRRPRAEGDAQRHAAEDAARPRRPARPKRVALAPKPAGSAPWKP